MPVSAPGLRELAYVELRSNAAIAASLVITERAVEKHVTNIFNQLDLPSSDADHRRIPAVLRYLAP